MLNHNNINQYEYFSTRDVVTIIILKTNKWYHLIYPFKNHLILNSIVFKNIYEISLIL